MMTSRKFYSIRKWRKNGVEKTYTRDIGTPLLQISFPTGVAVSYTHLDVYKRQELERRREQAQTPEIAPKADTMRDAAAEVEKAYTDAIQQTDNDPMMDNLPWEVRDKVKSFQVNPQDVYKRQGRYPLPCASEYRF